MKNLKTTALILTALTTTAMTAHADYDAYVEPIALSDGNAVTINGEVLTDATVIEHDGVTMLPLRAICEKLEFEVIWNDESRKIELKKLPVYITLKPGEDAYTFSKTAPMSLGTAPTIIENKTYVPVNFIDEILGGEYLLDNGIIISYGDTEEDTAVLVYIKEKNDEGFLVEDFERGEVRLAVNESTVITDALSNSITADELSENDELYVKYSPEMTMSLPPLTVALEITKTNDIAKTVFEGTITELLTDEESGVISQIAITVDEEEIILNIDENIKACDVSGNALTIDDTFIGKTVHARTTGISTRSLPPQYPTTDIIVF